MPPSSTLASPPLLHPLHDSRSAVPVLDSAGSLPHNALVGSRKIWVYEQIPKSHPIKLVHAGTQGLPRWFSGMAHGGTVTHLSNKIISQLCNSAEKNVGNSTSPSFVVLIDTEFQFLTLAFIFKFLLIWSERCFMKSFCRPHVMERKEIARRLLLLAHWNLEGSHLKERKSGLGNESSKIKRMELSQKITYTLIPALLLVSKSTVTTSLLIFSIYWQLYGFFKDIFLDYVHQEVTRKWVLIYFQLLLILAKDTILGFDLV